MDDPFSANSQYSVESINRHLINGLLASLMHYRRLVLNYEQHRDASEAMLCIVLGSSLMHKMLSGEFLNLSKRRTRFLRFAPASN